MPSLLRLERDQRQRQRWRRRLSGWLFAVLVLAALGVVTLELLT